MFQIAVRVDISDAYRTLDRLAHRVRDWSPWAREQLDPMARQMIERQFATQGGLSPLPWAPLKPSTIASKARRGTLGKGTLRDSDALFNSLTQPGVAGQDLVIGPSIYSLRTLATYAIYHRTGTSRMARRDPVPDPVPPDEVGRWAESLGHWLVEQA